MRAATPIHTVALPTPLFTRHMVGATEAERDRVSMSLAFLASPRR